jgi:predicted alpha/beta hydrolase family esterase
MKTALLLHGTDGSGEDYFWFADTKKYLESKGYEVWWPALPNTKHPQLIETREFIEKHYNLFHWNKDMIIIGHSSACPLILNIMEDFKVKIKKVILVSGYYIKRPDEGSTSMLPKSFNWNKIKQHAEEIIIINSDNDPWFCDDKQARPVAKELGAKFVLAKSQGHMGSDYYKQPYREFNLLKQLI